MVYTQNAPDLESSTELRIPKAEGKVEGLVGASEAEEHPKGSVCKSLRPIFYVFTSFKI